jgi:hypothetical protein
MKMGLCLDSTISTSYLREHQACNFYTSLKYDNVNDFKLASVYLPAATGNN